MPEEVDPTRPLSDKGRLDVKSVASYAAPFIFGVEDIFHSGSLRARQTAEILSQHIMALKGVHEAEGLRPLDDPMIWFERLRQEVVRDTVLVSHLPLLSRLISLLLFDFPDKKPVDFKTAGMVCLREEEKVWSIDWILTPEVVRT